MVLNIFFREILASRLMQAKGIKKYLNIFFSLLALVILAFIVYYVYNLFYERLNVFTNFSRSFLVILVSIFTLFLALYSVKDLNKVYFNNSKEKILLQSRPIDIYSIIFGKLLYVYLKVLLYTFLTSFIVIILYGINNQFGVVYCCYSILNSCFLALLSLSIGLIFTIIWRLILNYLNKHKVLLIIFTIILSFTLAILYAFLLYLFVNLVRNEGINTLFNSNTINILTDTSRLLYPIYNLISFNLNINKLVNLLIALGIILSSFFISFILFRVYYSVYLHRSSSNDIHYLDHRVKLTSPFKALLKKEVFLSFNNEDGVFSYLSLILVEPLLIYVVVSAINLIFNTGNLNYIRFLYPNSILAIDTLLITLFISVINANSNIAIDKERLMLIKLKTLPIKPHIQLSIKLLVSLLISSLFYLVSLLVLLIMDSISPISFIFLFLIGVFILLILNIGSIYSDLKTRNGLLGLIFDFVLPTIFIVIAFIISLLFNISEINFYLIILGLEVIITILLLINYRKRLDIAFIKREVSL